MLAFSENYRKKSIFSLVKRTAFAALIGASLSGCLESGSSSSDDAKLGGGKTPTVKDVSISGFAVKGILAGAVVKAYDISGTTLLAETTTNAQGKYTLPAINHDGPILVKLETSADTEATCDSAVGCDDGTATKVAFGAKYAFNKSGFSLSAVLPSAKAAEQQELMVTPVTNMAAARIKKAAQANGGSISSADVVGLNQATATLLGLDGIDINTITPVDITDATATNSGSAAAKLYGTLVASIQTLAEKDATKDITQVVDGLATDYADNDGLVSKSADDSKVTLDKIFLGAIEVVTAAKDKATANSETVELTEAEGQLETEQTETDNAEVDIVVVVTPTPVDPVDPVDPTDPTELSAVEKGINLLLDLNLWEDELTAQSNTTLTQPFADQLESTEAVMSSISDQSDVLGAFAKLVGEEYQEFECYHEDMYGECIYGDTYSEIQPGPVLGLIDAVRALVQLTATLENTDGLVSGTFNYGDQLSDVDGIVIEDITDLISEDDEVTDISAIAYDLDAAFTVRDNRIASITYTLAPLNDTATTNFEITLTQDNAITGQGSDGTSITFGISADYINLPSEGVTITIPQGTAEAPMGIAKITFASANDRLSFSNSTLDIPSITKVTDIDIRLATQTVLTEAATETTVEKVTTADLVLDFDYNYNLSAAEGANNATATIELKLDTANLMGEQIKGTLTVSTEGIFSETEGQSSDVVPVSIFTRTMQLKDATASFVGNITAKATNELGVEQVGTFEGSITADAGFFAPLTNAEVDNLVDAMTAKFEGDITVSTTPTGGLTSSVGFDGSLEAKMVLVKTPQGTPFKLYNEEQYHIEKVKLYGLITAKQDIDAKSNIADRSSAIEINAVVNASIAGLEYNPVNLPENEDELSVLKYGVRSIDANSAETFADFSDAINDAVAALATKGVDATLENGDYIVNATTAYQRSNCSTPDVGGYEICDITSTLTAPLGAWVPSSFSQAEVIASAQEQANSQAGRFDEGFYMPEVETELTLTSADATETVITANCTTRLESGTGLDMVCPIVRELSATANIPTELTDNYDASSYLRGLDSIADADRDFDIQVSSCTPLEGNPDYNNCSVATTRYFKKQYVYTDGSNSIAELEQAVTTEYDWAGDIINNIVCTPKFIEYGDGAQAPNGGECSFDSTTETSTLIKSAYSNEQKRAIAFGISNRTSNPYSYSIPENCTGSCPVTLSMTKYFVSPEGLTDNERQLYLDRIRGGYITSEANLEFLSCSDYEYYKLCHFNLSSVVTHHGAPNQLTQGLTHYIATILPKVTSNGYLMTLHAELDSQYGEFNLTTGYAPGELTFDGNLEIGEEALYTRPMHIDYFYPEFDAEEYAAGDEAFVDVDIAASIKADLTGLPDAEISLFIDRLGKDDSKGTVKFINGTRVVELNFNSEETFNNGTMNNLIIRNADAEMKVVLTCATDKNDAGQHDNDNITACADGINMQGDIYVDDTKVADLEDRNGLPVFTFSDGSGYDLVITPNFIVQPSAPQFAG